MEYSYCTTALIAFLQIFTLTISTTQTSLAQIDSLTYSQVVCRHGNRNPLLTYGKYTENYNNIWPEGLGKLSELGKYEGYQIGQFLRDRYAGFLHEDYKPNEIFVLSSGTDRTVQTAGISMLGLFKKFMDAASWKTDPSLVSQPFEPIPIRTIPSELDNVLSLNADCPKRAQSIEDIRKSNFNQGYFRNDSTLEYILQNTGQPNWLAPNATYEDIHWELNTAIEVITSLFEQNKTVEDWMLPLFSDEQFLAYKYHLIEKEHAKDLRTHRLNIGSLIKLILENINNHLRGTREEKLDVFIGHDKNLLSLGWTLAINASFENRMPPAGSCILVELHSKPKAEE
ncbi:unnamed protein product, partial [Allacma fusca]